MQSSDRSREVGATEGANHKRIKVQGSSIENARNCSWSKLEERVCFLCAMMGGWREIIATTSPHSKLLPIGTNHAFTTSGITKEGLEIAHY